MTALLLQVRSFLRAAFLLSSIVLLFSSCTDESNNDEIDYDPSVIEFELQTIGDLSGGIFTEKQTLSRVHKDYQADDECGAIGIVDFELDDSSKVLDIVGWGNGVNEQVKLFYLRVPTNQTGNYVFDPDTSDIKNFTFRLETTYFAELRAGYEGAFRQEKKLSVTISEISDERVKGSFTADLVYYNIDSEQPGRTLLIDEELTNVNQPIINGTFDVFRSQN